MEMNVRDDQRLVEIWLTNAEKIDPVLREGLKEIYAKYKTNKYMVAVFESGKGDLYENTRDLLLFNRRRSAEKAVQQAKKQRAVRRHGQARHMIALPFVEPFHDPVPFDNSCIHVGSSSCNVRHSSAASIGASRRSKVKRPSGSSA